MGSGYQVLDSTLLLAPQSACNGVVLQMTHVSSHPRVSNEHNLTLGQHQIGMGDETSKNR